MTPAKQMNAVEYESVRQLQAGDEMAYRQFIEQYQSKVYQVAYGILGHSGDADEDRPEGLGKGLFFDQAIRRM